MRLDLSDILDAEADAVAAYRIARRQWHRWFAWYPVLVDDVLVWLETVERRTDVSLATTYKWEYRLRG
jgi:hypothetical protein